MTWLPQRQPAPDVLLLRDYPGAVVRLDCQHCPRAGWYTLAGLVQRFGLAASLPEVLAALSGDCYRATKERAPQVGRPSEFGE